MEDNNSFIKKRAFPRPYVVSEIKLFWDQKSLYVNADYQRDYCWNLRQKQCFIDSLIRGYDIPKIYFWDKDDSQNNFEIVDGQQRISTIISFINNEFQLNKDEYDHLDLSFFGAKYKVDLRGKLFKDFDTNHMMAFNTIRLDVIQLSGYDIEEIKEIFVRHQMGTALNGAQKRKPLKGNVSSIVAKISTKNIFNKDKYLSFNNIKDAYRDSADKLLHEALEGKISGVNGTVLEKMYKNNMELSENDPRVKNLETALDFLANSFEGKDAKIKKVELRRLTWLVQPWLKDYNLRDLKDEFADVFIEFNKMRIQLNQGNEDVPEDILEYNNKLRADDVSGQHHIHNRLITAFLDGMENLKARDSKRIFTDEQKWFIFQRDGRECVLCNKVVTLNESETDHIVAHSKGGPTTVSNGQNLCSTCNKSKGNS